MLVGLHPFSYSQTIHAEVDRDKILIGEQIQLKLTIENARTVTGWFNIPDSINHIEVVERPKIDTLNVNGDVTLQQTILLTSFDSGRWEFPSLAVKGINQATPPITIDVLPVDVSHLQDYHDIKDIEEAEAESNTAITIIIAVITLLSLLMLYWLNRRKKANKVIPPVNLSNHTPLEWALLELNKLQAAKLYEKGKVKQHYSQLVDITREYFHLQLRKSPMQLTLDEWILDINSMPVSSEVKIAFIQLLRMSSSVKFAKYLPSLFDDHESVTIAHNMVSTVADYAQQSNYQPAAK